jgi:hypothetical protein
VILLATHGFDTVGLEISAQAVDTARSYAASASSVKSTTQSLDRGELDFVKGDFFSQDWQSNALGGTDGFDLVYDYTVRPTASPGKDIDR